MVGNTLIIHIFSETGAREGHRREDRDDKDREGSPSPGSGNKRRKVASGSGGSCSSKESGTLGHQDAQPPSMAAMDLGRSKENAEDGPHDFDKEAMLSMAGGLGKPDLANYVPNQRLEWKRYKQYTRNDIMSAIEEVKNGKKHDTVWKNEKFSLTGKKIVKTVLPTFFDYFRNVCIASFSQIWRAI